MGKCTHRTRRKSGKKRYEVLRRRKGCVGSRCMGCEASASDRLHGMRGEREGEQMASLGSADPVESIDLAAAVRPSADTHIAIAGMAHAPQWPMLSLPRSRSISTRTTMQRCGLGE